MMHIIPINDSKEHDEESTCHCKPNVIEGNGELIVIHNSFDGREIFEQAKENISNGSADN